MCQWRRLDHFKNSKCRCEAGPNHSERRYEIEIHSGVSMEQVAEAEAGTIRDGRLIHPMNPERSVSRLRLFAAIIVMRREMPEIVCDFGAIRLRAEERGCVSGTALLHSVDDKASLGKGRQETFFTGVTSDDLAVSIRLKH